MEQLKICNKCKISKTLDDFHKRKNGKYSRDHHCKLCSNTRRKIKYNTDDEYKERCKRKNLKQLYNLTDIELNSLHFITNCQICETEFKNKMYIDIIIILVKLEVCCVPNVIIF